MSNQRLLNVEDLHVSFFTHAGEVRAVNGVSFTLDKGEILGIVGESGSGKSVTVNSIMQLIPPPGKTKQGTIEFDGVRLDKLSERQINAYRGNDISMIFQDPMSSLNPLFTIGNQLVETLRQHTDMSRKAAGARAIELLDMVGIPQADVRLKQYPHEFSGGMRQRAMIAMALSCEPKLLIADEPTTALDVTIQAQILSLMKNLRSRVSAAIILITHDLGIVSDICDRVNVMYAGQTMESGTVDELVYHPAHPYTRGLLSCLPSLADDERKPLVPIEGTPVDLMLLPKGCPFAARCTHCMRVCIDKRPDMIEVTPGHFSQCWLNALDKAKGGA